MAEAKCVHPPDADAKKTALYRKIFHDYYLGRWSYNIIPEYRSGARHNEERREQRSKSGHLRSIQNFQSRIYGEPKCRRNWNFTQNSSISTKSTCPWFVVIDVDFNREPQAMAKAKCSCKRCLAEEGGRQRGGRCVTLSSYVPVIKWGCPDNYSSTDNFYSYFIHMEEVPVGCSCRRSTKSWR